MRTISLESFDKETRSEGLWTLQDANEPERALLQELEPDKQVEQVLIPTKYIKEGEYLVIVQVTEQGSVGIKKYHKRDVEILSNKRTNEITVYLTKGKAEFIVENYDFVDERYKTEVEIMGQMIATGYLTEEEWDKYIKPESHNELHIIRKIMI
jgi:hypothetical protein